MTGVMHGFGEKLNMNSIMGRTSGNTIIRYNLFPIRFTNRNF